MFIKIFTLLMIVQNNLFKNDRIKVNLKISLCVCVLLVSDNSSIEVNQNLVCLSAPPLVHYPTFGSLPHP